MGKRVISEVFFFKMYTEREKTCMLIATPVTIPLSSSFTYELSEMPPENGGRGQGLRLDGTFN